MKVTGKIKKSLIEKAKILADAVVSYMNRPYK